jgi:hypothetical protein
MLREVSKSARKIKNNYLSVAWVIGLSIVCVLGLSSQAKAADITLTGAATWGTAANGMAGSPGSGDNLIATTHASTFDGSHGGDNTVGAVTSTTGHILFTNDDNTGDVAFTVGSITASGASNLTIELKDETTRDLAIAVSGNVALTTGNLIMTHAEPDATATSLLSVGGTLAVGGTTAIAGGTNASASTTTLTVTGNATFTGAVTLSSTVNAAASAILNLNGATNVATAGIELNDATGLSILNFTSTATSTMAGAITGNGDGEGTVNILGGTNKLTFSTAVGTTSNSMLALNIGSATLGGNAEFDAAVDATTITVFTQVAADAVADFDAAVVGAVVITGGNGSGEDASASFAANVTGNITLTPNSGAATATFDGSSAQTITGNMVAGADEKGVLKITNTGGTVTFNGVTGVAGTGLEEIHIASGATMHHKSLAAATTFDVVTTVDADGAGTKGGTLILEGGDAVTTTDGGALTLATVTTNTNLTALTVQGGDAATTGVGGAVTATAFVGTTNATTYTVKGGAGGADGAATGGVGGAVATHLQTGATTATTLNLIGGNGGVGVANDASGVGGAGGAVGSSANTFTGLITATTVNVTAGNGATGGNGGSGETGGVGGAGGAVTVTNFDGGLTGALNVTGGDGGNGGIGNATSNLGGNGGDGALATLTSLDVGGDLGNVVIAAGAGGTGGVSGVANGGIGVLG